jgi:hypothetical protein
VTPMTPNVDDALALARAIGRADREAVDVLLDALGIEQHYAGRLDRADRELARALDAAARLRIEGPTARGRYRPS